MQLSPFFALLEDRRQFWGVKVRATKCKQGMRVPERLLRKKAVRGAALPNPTVVTQTIICYVILMELRVVCYSSGWLTLTNTEVTHEWESEGTQGI